MKYFYVGYEIFIATVAVLIFGIGIWGGATIKGAHMDRYMEAAINNAISHTLETSGSGLSCKDNEIIDAIRGLAENGAHIQGFTLRLDMGNGVGAW